MITALQSIKTERLKDVFISRFERMILSGEIGMGQKLPSERELAARLGVSRPVVHEGLMELAAKGLVTMKPRAGAVVNDYRRHGSLPLISSLLEYGEGRLDRRLMDSIIELRELLECRFARLAANHRTEEHLEELRAVVERERSLDPSATDDVVSLDFEFHLLVALATGNLVFPLLINSFRQVYTNLTGQFFQNPAVMERVHRFHRELLGAIADGDPDRSEAVMKEMLTHGERILTAMLHAEQEDKRAGAH